MPRTSLAAKAVLGLFLMTASVLLGSARDVERGRLAILFMGERVGYEEYVWTQDDEGFRLEVEGLTTKPTPLEIESLTLELNRDFIPLSYSFKGSLNGVRQEVESRILDGRVTNTILVAGQALTLDAQVRRNALILPNPVFSTYLVLAKKTRCLPQAATEVAAYIIPQLEIIGTLASDPADPCLVLLDLGGIEVRLLTDGQGRLISLEIPSQGLRVEALS